MILQTGYESSRVSATVAGSSGTTVELRVERPPTSDHEKIRDLILEEERRQVEQ